MKKLAPRKDVKVELGPFVTDQVVGLRQRNTVSPLAEQRGYDSLNLRLGANYQSCKPLDYRSAWSLNTPASHCPAKGLLPPHVLTTPFPHSGPAPSPAEFITSWYQQLFFLQLPTLLLTCPHTTRMQFHSCEALEELDP